MARAGLELASTMRGIKGLRYHCLALGLSLSYDMVLESEQVSHRSLKER